MSPDPGWYPDPGGQPGTLRYWDGRAWSGATAPAPPGPGGPLPSGPEAVAPGFRSAGPGPSARSESEPGGRAPRPVVVRRPRALAWALGAIAAVLALVVIGVLALRGLTGTGGGDDPVTDPTGGPVCPRASAAAPTAAPDTAERVVSGRMSYPRLGSPFSAPRSDARTPFGRDVRTQTAVVEQVAQGPWVAQVLIARLLAGDGFYGPEQGAAIVARCVIGKFYWDYPVAREDRRNQATTVDGRPAWIVEMHLTFDIPNLQTKGETATIVVVDTGDGEAGLFYSSIPDTSPQYDRPAAEALRQLQIR